ncbi:hypothetical protein Pmani_028673 [Petrolisthes manimaculis]|uniref:MADF domain-containing protein n=1 Tax=Petrolisthes manimaculis TaxID=1843537 RepID=A0AAE1P1L5_9EUCA|nr:hypothetical protein Pmani_028673 [Petrolisthes manimaculis]
MSTLDNEKLIHEVSRSSCIWNPSHTQHNDRIFIAQQWERIGDQLNVSGENAKKRFKNLRDQFRLELKKVPTGRAGDPDLPLDQYRSNWPWFKMMFFLKDQMKGRGPNGKMLVLKEDSSTLDAFLIPPVPIYMQFYLFNVTNPDEIRTKGAKPIIREVGPYTYDEHREKYDLQWDHSEGTVTYYQNKSFVFNPDMSPGHSEDDPVTTINAVMVSIASKVEPLGPVVEALVEFAFLRFSETIFITKTVGELLWGYDEPLMTELSKYVGDPTNNKGKFGFFYPVGLGWNEFSSVRLSRTGFGKVGSDWVW